MDDSFIGSGKLWCCVVFFAVNVIKSSDGDVVL